MNKFYKLSWSLVYLLFLAFCSVTAEPIVNGDIVQIKQYPHQVYLSALLLPTCLKNSWFIKLFPCIPRKGLFCGGSIVNKRYILTAAHCVDKMKLHKIEIYAGANRIGDANAQVHTAQAFIMHPEYHSSALMFNKTNPKYAKIMMNDIALIRLKEDIQFTEVIRPVKLPRSNYHLNEVAFVTGWGYTNYNKPLSKFLRATQQKIISWKSCDRQWQLKYLSYIDKGMMCAITYNHAQASGPCGGDSGGPLVDKDNYQIGIISFGYECGKTHNLPDVYVNVWEYVKWIRNNAKI